MQSTGEWPWWKCRDVAGLRNGVDYCNARAHKERWVDPEMTMMVSVGAGICRDPRSAVDTFDAYLVPRAEGNQTACFEACLAAPTPATHASLRLWKEGQ